MEVQKKKTSTAKEFAEEIGVDSGLISKIKRHVVEVSNQTISLIKVRYPDVNIEWIKSGTGSMLDEIQLQKPKVEYFNHGSGLYNYHQLVKKVSEIEKAVTQIKKILKIN